MKKRQGMKRGIILLPNLITTANLFCGFFSITRSLEGHFEYAAWLVILATFFDFLDGRVARITGTQSDFGVEYDSLADLTTFCMAPAILAYRWGLYEFGKFGIAACFLFFACGALRLARYNVQVESVERDNFQGLPSPSSGGTICAFVIFFQEFLPTFQLGSLLLIFTTVCLGLLMVSSVKYRSFKKIRRTSFLFLVAVIGIIFVFTAKPEAMFFIFAVGYVLTGVAEWIWKSPQKIRNLTDLIQHLYNARKEQFIYDDEEGPADNEDNPSDQNNVLRF